MRVIILCGGIGSRMCDYSMPKPLNMIYGKPAIYYVLKNIPEVVTELFFIYAAHLKRFNFEEIIMNLFKNKKCIFYCVDYLTRGPVETAYIGTSKFDMNENESVVFLDNDNIYNFPDNFFENKEYNFLGVSVDTSGTTKYSFVQQQNNIVFDIVEKERISNLYCCGVYGFQNLNVFRNVAQALLTTEVSFSKKDEIYMSDIYRYLLTKNKLIKTIDFNNQGNHIGSLAELECSLKYIESPKMRICFDLDNTLVTYPTVPGDYTTVRPIKEMINLVQQLHSQGHTIIIHTARRMATHKSNVGAVIKDIGKVTFDSLEKFQIPYDELIFGKPIADIYIDDRAVNPYRGDFTYMGIFNNIQKEYIVNKLPNNNYNSLQLINNRIIKEGPSRFMCGEYYVYSQLYKFPTIRHYFPECYSFSEKNKECKLEIEYIKGIPLSFLFKHNLLHKDMILELINIISQLHNSILSEIEITKQDIYYNYINKLNERFSNNSDYPFEDKDNIQNKIITKLQIYLESDRVKISPFIHGDFWFSNIIYTFDKKMKCFDMKGIVNNKLTTNGDILYDYGKLYQSLLGYDLIIWDCHNEYDDYKKSLCSFYEEQIIKLGIRLEDLRAVTISLIVGTLHANPINKKEKIWNFVKSLLS